MSSPLILCTGSPIRLQSYLIAASRVNCNCMQWDHTINIFCHSPGLLEMSASVWMVDIFSIRCKGCIETQMLYVVPDLWDKLYSFPHLLSSSQHTHARTYVKTKTWDGDFTWGTTKQMREIKNQFYPRMYLSDRFIEDRKYKVRVSTNGSISSFLQQETFSEKECISHISVYYRNAMSWHYWTYLSLNASLRA
jgi:hypothetical protein